MRVGVAARDPATAAHCCIWCLEEKPQTEFNVEHVIPQAFGTFEQNFNLDHEVCSSCNGFFGRELEPWLTRDSLEGFDRFRYGLKSTEEFKSLGLRSTSRVQMKEGTYVGAWGYTVSDVPALGVRLFPQIGFSRTPDGPFEYFPLGELPTQDIFTARGYAHLRFCECTNPEETRAKLAEKGISTTLTDVFAPASGGAQVEQVFRPNVSHRRALAKIALNYLAHQFGAKVALEPRFDSVRTLVMAGTEPDHKYFDIDERPIVTGDKQDGARLFGHILLVKQRGHHDVEGVVSLFNRFRHGFHLAWSPGNVLEPRGHFFDLKNRVIVPMTPS